MLKGKLPTEYLDPLCYDEAALFGVSTWDYVRIFEQAVRFVHRYLDLRMLPDSWYLTKPYLSYLGYAKRMAGYQVRSILPHLTLFAEVLGGAVTESTLNLVEPLPSGGHVLRQKHVLDSISFGKKQKSLKHLKYRRNLNGYSADSL